MSEVREKFATQVDAALLDELRTLSKQDGRQIQALVDEAIRDLLDKHKGLKPRDHVMAAFRTSHNTYADLYKKLAE